MLVKELIEKLQAFNGELEVRRDNGSYFYLSDIREAEAVMFYVDEYVHMDRFIDVANKEDYVKVVRIW